MIRVSLANYPYWQEELNKGGQTHSARIMVAAQKSDDGIYLLFFPGFVTCLIQSADFGTQKISLVWALQLNYSGGHDEYERRKKSELEKWQMETV